MGLRYSPVGYGIFFIIPPPLQDEDSVEVLTFALAHPLCLVREVDIRPFKAFFQWVRASCPYL